MTPHQPPAFFTICAKNFLAYARTLHASVREHHPDARFYVALCDRIDGMIDPAAERAQRQEASGAGALSPQEQGLRRKQERLLQAFPTLQAFDAWRDAQLADYDRQIAQIRALLAEGTDPDALVPTLQRLLDERRTAAERLAAERRELEEALRAQQQGR